MSPKEGSPYLERIGVIKERVSRLGESGADVSKVLKILENLESTIDSVKETEKVEEAFTKFENLITKMESKGKTPKRKKVEKEEAPPKKKKKAKPSKEEDKKEEPPPEEEKIKKPAPEEEKKEEPSQPEEVKEKIEEPPAPAPSGEMDIELMENEVKTVEEMSIEIVELGGDPSPIKPHMDGLKKAKDDKNTEEFHNFLATTKDWLVQYLTSLRKSSIDGLVEQFNSRASDFSKVDQEERIKDLKQEMEGSLGDYDKADLEVLGSIWKKVQDNWDKMEGVYSTLTEELTKLINESAEKIESVLGEISGEIDTTSLKDELQEMKEHLFNGEYVEARIKSQELMVKVVGERDSKDIRKLESMLLSIEPLITKIESSEGSDSEVFKALVEERESIIERSRENVKDALKLMEDLLDKTTRSSADLEERNIRKIEERINTFKEEAQILKDTIDVSPILNILEKAGSLLMGGEAEKASFMVEKAETAYSKLKEKRVSDVAVFRINELQDRVVVLAQKGIDTSPLEEPLASASKAAGSGDMETFEKTMSTIDERLLFIRNEELKVDYQKGLIKVVNSLKELRDDGQDVSDLEQEMESFKNLYMERKYEESVEAAEVLLHRVGGRKLYKVIDERKRIVEETLKEAEGLLVEIDLPTEKFNSANEFIQKKDFEKALDLLIEAQVELEERMTQRTFSLVENEIRELVKECTESSIDPGDYEGVISTAYSMADEEKFREAMELLSKFRERLSRKVALSNVEGLMKKMVLLIKKGRILGIQVIPYKASMTKSRVLLDAGDVEEAYQLISGQADTLEATIKEKKTLIARLDKLRGNLLAQEGKLSRLERSGVPVDEFKDRVERVKQLIEDSNQEDAETELVSMDQDINALLLKKPEQLKKEMMTTIMEEQESRPLSIDRLKPPQAVKAEGPIDTDQARSELFVLIPKIKVEITRLHSKGVEVEEFKQDIERIQNLVIKREYLKAYELGRTCYRRMTS